MTRYEIADYAFKSDSVLSDDNEKLISYLWGLQNHTNTSPGTEQRDVIRGITINHLLLQRHIDRLDKQNTKTQRLVIVLTVAALLSGISQIWLAYRADRRAETEQKTIATQQQAPAPQSVAPSPAIPPSSDQPEKKTP
jgi:hypothetical protein